MVGMPLAALLLVCLYRSPSWWVSGFLFRTFLAAVVLSGTLNLIHELQGGGWPEYSHEEIDLANWLRKETSPDAIFLTAPVHNNVLMLAGRQVILGYAPHVYSHGVRPDEVEEAVRTMYSGAEGAEEEIARRGIDYIVLGPRERSTFGDEVSWLEGRYPEFIRSGDYVVYRAD